MTPHPKPEPKPILKLYEPPEERPRMTQREAYSSFVAMLEAKMPRIAEGTERSR